MQSDFRLTFRALTKARGFAVVAILTLAVGIGASTAMFSALRALIITPFRHPNPDELVHVWSGDRWPLSAPDFLDLKEQATSFVDFGVYSPQSVNIGGEKPRAVSSVSATAGVLRAFGTPPLMGRLLEENDELKGAAPVAVIAYGLWQENYGGDPNLLGRTIRLNGSDVTVVGIMPGSFEFTAPWMRTRVCQVWLPQQLKAEGTPSRDSHWLCGIARLKPGVTVAQAEAEIKSLGRQLTAKYPDSNTNKLFLVRPLKFEMTRDIGKHVWMLSGAVALVLLVACANVASMLLARSAQRQSEFAVRMALGARGRDLVRLALMESLALAVAGALVGLGVAFGGTKLLQLVAPVSAARKAAIHLDLVALAFASGATLFTAIIAGIPPALAARRTSISHVMRTDARGATASRSRHLMLRTLVIAQIAVAFVLASGAALFSKSYLKLLEDNAKLSTEYVLSARVSLNGARYEKDEQRTEFWRELRERLLPMPGVTAVGLTSKLPLEGGNNTNALVNDETYDPKIRRRLVERSSITPGYFEAVGIKLIRGRDLIPADAEGEVTGVVINRKFAESAWPGKDPLGQLLRGNNPGKPWYVARVVGVAEDVRQWGAESEVQDEMYTTPKGHWGRSVVVLIRSSQPAAGLVAQLRKEVAAIDPELSIENARTLKQLVRDSTSGQRAVSGMINTFMAIALGLVAVGLYGTLSYNVLQRTREFGVRLAIGAVRGDITRLVLKQGSWWVLIGLSVGIAGSLGLAKVLRTIVYGVDPLSTVPLLLGAICVTTAALFACWLPAYRAAKTDPMHALRAD